MRPVQADVGRMVGEVFGSTGTRLLPATASITSSRAAVLSQRVRPITMLASASPPAMISVTSSTSRRKPTEYCWRSSGVVRYCGKWKASTARAQRIASEKAMTPLIMPMP